MMSVSTEQSLSPASGRAEEFDVFKKLKNTFMPMEWCDVITFRGTVYKLHDTSMEDQHEEQARDKREDTEGHVTVTSAVIGGGAEEEGSGGADEIKYMMKLMQDKQKEQVQAKIISA